MQIIWWTRRQLKSKDSQTRLKALQKLSASNHPKIIKYITPILKDEEVQVRELVIDMLKGIKSNEVVELLIAGLKDPSYHIRIKSMEALINISDFNHPTIIEHIISTMRDEQVHVRELIIDMLTGIGMEKEIRSKEAVELLIIALNDPSYHVRIKSMEALIKIKESIILGLKGNLSDRISAINVLNKVRNKETVVSPLVDLLFSYDFIEGEIPNILDKIFSALDTIEPGWKKSAYVIAKINAIIFSYENNGNLWKQI